MKPGEFTYFVSESPQLQSIKEKGKSILNEYHHTIRYCFEASNEKYQLKIGKKPMILHVFETVT